MTEPIHSFDYDCECMNCACVTTQRIEMSEPVEEHQVRCASCGGVNKIRFTLKFVGDDE